MDPDDRSVRSMDLGEAIKYSRRYLEDKKSEESSNTGFRTRMWDFVRLLRGCPELADLNPRDAFTSICSAAQVFCPKNEDPWKDGLKFSDEDEIEFLTTWSKVKYAAGVDHLEEAVSKADSQPLIPETNRSRRNHDYEKFISIAAHLQTLVGPETNILLPLEKLAKHFGEEGVTPSWISRLRQLAVLDGYLEEKEHYQWSSSGGGKATEFRFRIDLFPELHDPPLAQHGDNKLDEVEL